MLVEIVTEAGRPACAMISASRSAASAFAFSTRWGTWSSSSFSENASVDSTDVVPTSTGRPSLLIASSSCSAAFDLPRTFLYTDVGTSARAVGSTGGTSRTLSLYIVPNSSASVSAVPLIDESFSKRRKRLWYVIDAMTSVSG